MKRGDHVIVGIDLETGGFEPGVHGILAIGCHWSEPGTSRDLRLLVEREEGTVVEASAAAKNGWESDAQWLARGAVPLRDALDILAMWLTDLSRTTGALTFELVSHNHAGVDRPFLEYWTKRYDLEGLFWGTHGLLSHAWHDSMLTMRALQAAGLLPAEGGASLDALRHVMGWSAAGVPQLPVVHDALEDARACYAGYQFLTGLMGPQRARLEEGKPSDGAMLTALQTLCADVVARMGDDPGDTRIAIYGLKCHVRGPEEGRRFTVLAGEGAGAELLERCYEASSKVDLFNETKTLPPL